MFPTSTAAQACTLSASTLEPFASEEEEDEGHGGEEEEGPEMCEGEEDEISTASE